MSKLLNQAIEALENNREHLEYREGPSGIDNSIWLITEKRGSAATDRPFQFIYNAWLDRFEDLEGAPVPDFFSRNLERATCKMLAVIPCLEDVTLVDGTKISMHGSIKTWMPELFSKEETPE